MRKGVTTGNSWYNKYGFDNEENNEIIKTYNEFVSGMSLNDVLNINNFLSIISEQYFDNEKINKNLKFLKERMMTRLMRMGQKITIFFNGHFTEFDLNDSVRNIVLRLKQKYLNKNYKELLDESQCNGLIELFEYLDLLIIYNRDLKLFFGGKNKKQYKRIPKRCKRKSKCNGRKSKCKRYKSKQNITFKCKKGY